MSVAAKGTLTTVNTNTQSSSSANPINDGSGGTGDNGGGGQTAEEIEAQKLLDEQAEAAKGKPIVDENAMKEYFKANGIEWDGDMEGLKNKMKPAQAQPTEEEIKQQAAAHDKRLVDLFVKKGGTVDNFVAIKQLMTADPTEMSKTVLHKQLLDEGLDEESAIAVSKQMHLEQDLDNLEQGATETDEVFNARKEKLQKQIGVGAKVLANLGLPVIQNAKRTYEGLENELKQMDSDNASEAELSNKIDAHFKTLPREFSVEIGKINDKDVEPVKVKLSEEDVTAVAEILKDKTKWDALVYDDKGQFNFTKIAEILLRNKALESAAGSSYKAGQTKQVEEFAKRFPARSANSVAPGSAHSAPNGTSTKVAKAGVATRV